MCVTSKFLFSSFPQITVSAKSTDVRAGIPAILPQLVQPVQPDTAAVVTVTVNGRGKENKYALAFK